LKSQELKAHQATNKEELIKKTREALKRMAKRPALIRSFFKRCNITYIMQRPISPLSRGSKSHSHRLATSSRVRRHQSARCLTGKIRLRQFRPKRERSLPLSSHLISARAVFASSSISSILARMAVCTGVGPPTSSRSLTRIIASPFCQIRLRLTPFSAIRHGPNSDLTGDRRRKIIFKIGVAI
jgi:hypothetical protein